MHTVSALEDRDEDMFVVRFEDLLREPEATLRRICEHVELDFRPDMLPAPHHRIPLGSRFRNRWYPLSLERALHYIEKATPDEIELIDRRCRSIANDLGYKAPGRAMGM
jgi:hypothetical protein